MRPPGAFSNPHTHLTSHRHDTVTVYSLQVSLNSCSTRVLQNFVLMGHYEHYIQTGQQEMSENTHAVCAFLLSSHAPLSYWTSLLKHKFKDKVIKNVNMEAAENSTKRGALLSMGSF